ncbi:hypothetical protein HDU76_000050 [Blyttiomyces sp. JEL0837]|nr:hypothetical protein HDU76_000050 [Blyttiomyces sp. JEL0837]
MTSLEEIKSLLVGFHHKTSSELTKIGVELSSVRSGLSSVQSGLDKVQKDVSELQEDVKELKAGQGTLLEEVVRKRVEDIKSTIPGLDEDSQPTIKVELGRHLNLVFRLVKKFELDISASTEVDLIPLKNRLPFVKGDIIEDSFRVAINEAPDWLRKKMIRLQNAISNPESSLSSCEGPAIMCIVFAANESNAYLTNCRHIPETLEIDLRGTGDVTHGYVLADVGEVKSARNSFGNAVKQLVARAKVYAWVGEAQILTKFEERAEF